MIRILIICRHESPAPKANKDLAKEKFYTEMVKAKTALAFGVRVNVIVRSSYSSFGCKAIFRDLSRKCSFAEGSLPT